MSRFVRLLAPAALALAALVMLSDAASAQRFGRGGYGGRGTYYGQSGLGYGSGYGTGWGYGNGYGNNWGSGNGYGNNWGSGNYGNNWGYGNYGSPYYGNSYSGYGRGYYNPNYNNSNSYWDGGRWVNNTGYSDGNWDGNNWVDNSGNANYGSSEYAYGAHSGGCGHHHHRHAAHRNAVVLELIVPPNAELWLNGEQTTQRGAVRSFVTPPLDDNKEYSYEVRMRTSDNGRNVDRTRRVNFKRGDVMVVDMSRGDQGGYMYGELDQQNRPAEERRDGNRQDQANRPSDKSRAGNAPAMIDVMVPSNAEVWINGEKTKQTGGIRSFITPALEGDRDHHYALKVKAGSREDTRQVSLHSGERIMLDMTASFEDDAQRSRPDASERRLPNAGDNKDLRDNNDARDSKGTRDSNTRDSKDTPRSEQVPRPKEKE